MTVRSLLQNHILKNSKVLDIGCGKKSHSNYSVNTTTIDAWTKLSPDILLDVEKEPLPFEKDSFDHITMIDFIEHLDKDKGEDLLIQCKDIVRDKIFIFTPLFFTNNAENVENPKCWAYGNPYDYHKSLWTLEEDFKDWTTLGLFPHKMGNQWLGYWQK